MTSRTSLAAAATLVALTLSACGGSAGADTAADPAADPTSTSTSPTPTPTGPTTAPKPGSLPDFPYVDYAYTLEQRCFCANIDQQYRVTVAGGKVVSVTWATAGDGHQVGDPVPADLHLSLTIQDVIDQGNDPKAAKINVDWPAGQLYPTSIFIDRDKLIADEEVTWVISGVVPA